tara:strand:- start:451 stop:888 length:438 start_codon:yes stop_codon:yes gene_type:complete
VINPSKTRIFIIGKVRKKWIQEGIAMYLKRLPGLTIIELRESNPQKETITIQSALKPNEKLITLSEDGERLSSITFAQRLENMGSQQIVFVVGGPNGLSKELRNSTFWNFSLSPLTFPHEIAGLLLIEQLYRAQSIVQGTSYHRQ